MQNMNVEGSFLEEFIALLSHRVNMLFARVHNLYEMALQYNNDKTDLHTLDEYEAQINAISDRLTALHENLARVIDFLTSFQMYCMNVAANMNANESETDGLFYENPYLQAEPEPEPDCADSCSDDELSNQSN